jgi:hypothetical protein
MTGKLGLTRRWCTVTVLRRSGIPLEMVHNKINVHTMLLTVCFNQPSALPVYDAHTGRIHLVFTRDNTDAFITHSDDAGTV